MSTEITKSKTFQLNSKPDTSSDYIECAYSFYNSFYRIDKLTLKSRCHKDKRKPDSKLE